MKDKEIINVTLVKNPLLEKKIWRDTSRQFMKCKEVNDNMQKCMYHTSMPKMNVFWKIWFTSFALRSAEATSLFKKISAFEANHGYSSLNFNFSPLCKCNTTLPLIPHILYLLHLKVDEADIEHKAVLKLVHIKIQVRLQLIKLILIQSPLNTC